MMKNNKINGYTLIETMIAISLFLVVTMAGMGALLNANLLHQKSQSMRSIMDSLSFVMDDMSRNLRTGYNFYCITGSDVAFSNTDNRTKSGSNCWGIEFESAYGLTTNANDQWVYYIGTNGIDSKIRIFKTTQGPLYNQASNYVELTPDEVVIDPVASSFSVLGAEPPPGDSQQPFVSIRLVGYITYKNVVTPFSLQTSVSQRFVDI